MRVWRENADPEKHRDFMSTRVEGGVPIEASRDSLIEKWVYLAKIDGFTFQFADLEQVRECRDYFASKIHPITREPNHNPHEHYWQTWHARLPKGMNNEKNRVKVIKAMEKILAKWGPKN